MLMDDRILSLASLLPFSFTETKTAHEQLSKAPPLLITEKEGHRERLFNAICLVYTVI